MVKQCIECGIEIEDKNNIDYYWCSLKCKEDFHKRYYSNSRWCDLDKTN